ncbi:MAG: gamma-glutamyltransferase, partial [Pseudomonadota bacterium]
MRPFPRHRRTGHASASSLRARWLAAARNLAITFALLAAQLTAAEAQRTRFEPEGGTGLTVKSSGARTGATAQRFMVAAANPLAVDAGIAVLKRGGSAVDAAIAVQLVLNLVEPQSSGIGGGAFLLHWDAASKSVTTYDGRETAPAAAKPDRFFKNGKRLPFRTAVHSGLSIGTPGLVKLLSAVHEKHGKLAWADLFQPAITLARDGFEISPRLHGLVSRYGAAAFGPRARAYFFDARGAAHPVGYLRTNLDFAATLQAIADGGPDAFYTGPIARAVIAAAKGAPNARGDLTIEDLAGYEVRERPPVCATYRDYSVCGMGPPSSGALTVAQTLAMIEPMTSAAGPGSAMSPAALHAIAEASKRAFADRGRYMADPDFVAVPSKG